MVVIECSPGYTGIGCFVKCPSPLYGKHCQKMCMCSTMEYCDFVFGCLQGKYLSNSGFVFKSSQMYVHPADLFNFIYLG